MSIDIQPKVFTEAPLLSIILPCYNEETDLPRCLASLDGQAYKNFEVIAINDGSTDGTGEILEDYARDRDNVRVIQVEQKCKTMGSGAPRNLGVQQAKGDILVFVDADVELGPDYLESITADIISGKTVGTMYGYEENGNYDKNYWTRCFGRVRWNALGEGKETYPVFSAILKSAFDRVGGFDPSRAYGSDHTIHIKSGLRAKVVDATSYHYNPESVKGIYEHAVWFGRGIPQRIEVRRLKDREGDPTLRKQLKVSAFFTLLLIGNLALVAWKFSLVHALLFPPALLVVYLFLRGLVKAIEEKAVALVVVFPLFLLIKYVAHCHGFVSYLISGQVAPVR